MGKGDIKTTRGKRFASSFGKNRKRKTGSSVAAASDLIAEASSPKARSGTKSTEKKPVKKSPPKAKKAEKTE